MKALYALVTSLVLLSGQAVAEIQPNNPFPRVEMVTTEGSLVIELDRQRAPITVANFLRYIEKAQYNGTVFHRIVPDFVVQGGGYDENLEEKPYYEEIVNESGNGLKNTYGTVAMARERDPHTATRQFFFNVADNESLNPSDKRWGYTVFGRVVEGQETLEKLAAIESSPYDEETGWRDLPPEPPVIQRFNIVPQS